jgi:hypothetical protein
MSLRASNGDTCVSDHSNDGRFPNGDKEANTRSVDHYKLWPRPYPKFEVGKPAVLRSLLILNKNGASEFIHQNWTFIEHSIRQTLHGSVKGLQAKYQPNSLLKPSLQNFWFDCMGHVEEMFYHNEATFEISSILYDPHQYPGIGAYHEYQLKDEAEKHLTFKVHEMNKYLELVRRLP